MQPQAIFDSTVVHLQAQGRRSLIQTPRGPEPAYRGEGGLKCPVGALIPDSCYDSKMEGRGLSDLFEVDLFPNFVQSLAWMGRNERLLRSLQLAHDLAQNHVYPETLPNRLKKIAVQHKLDVVLVHRMKWSWEPWA
jgi:hypothetical protein